jgi:hypothetical protein
VSYVTRELREMLASHVLTPVSRRGAVEAYYLHKEGSTLGSPEASDGANYHGPRVWLSERVLSTLILFSPEGIVLLGDLAPCAGKNGCISGYGYDARWFAEKVNEDYLCSKFLEQTFQVDVAKTWVEDRLADLRDPASGESDEATDRLLQELMLRLIENGDDPYAEEWFRDALRESKLGGDELEGYGYDLEQAGMLCAIQQRFAELYQKKEEEFYILSVEHTRGDFILWWKPQDCGYTTALDKAGRYAKSSVEERARYYNNGEKTLAIPCAIVDRMAPRHVIHTDLLQALRRAAAPRAAV